MRSPSAYDLKLLLSKNPTLYRGLGKPFRAARFLLRRPHDPDYGAFALFPERRGLFLDVGANAGQSALSFRIYRENPILSIEPNPFHRADLVLAGRLVRNFKFLICGAGAVDESLLLHVPAYRGIPITAEAALDADTVLASPSLRDYLGDRMEGPDFSIAAVPTRVIPLDELALSPDFVKLDVQGHEHAALQGMEETLRRSRPVLLVEAPGEEVRAYLDSLGYEPRLYDPAARSLVVEDRFETNTVFVPAAADRPRPAASSGLREGPAEESDAGEEGAEALAVAPQRAHEQREGADEGEGPEAADGQQARDDRADRV